MPKNPISGRIVSYDTVVANIKNGQYGDSIRDGFHDAGYMYDGESVKRTLFLAGRDFGHNTWNTAARNRKMQELVSLDENKGGPHNRFKLLLEKPDDRDLANQTTGAETNQETYKNEVKASGKTYRQLYGEQIVAIRRYLQQGGAFGCVEDMDKLVFFFRIDIFETCYLAAVCILASYLGQIAFQFKRVPSPPDLGKLIRMFKDQALYDYIMIDDGRDANVVLKDMMERMGNQRASLSISTEGDFQMRRGYDLEGKFEQCGPGLVSNFLCTANFHAAWEACPEWQENKGTVGYIRFHMKEGQSFESVKGEFICLKAKRGTTTTTQDEINDSLKAAEDKIATGSSWFNPSSKEEMVGGTNVARGGDRSAHICSPPSSPDSIQLSPRHDRTAVSNAAAALDDSRDRGDESIEAWRDGERSQSQVRDRPPVAEQDKKEESESRHAMVCFAGRDDKELNDTFYFLQNSWYRMPLVEVNRAYLIAAGAEVSFAAKKVHPVFKKLAGKDCFYEVNKSLVADASYSGPAP